MTRGTALLLVLLAVLWAAAFPLIKVALEGLSAPHLTLARHVAASLAFLVLMVAMRRPLLPAARDVPALLGLGFLGIFVYHLALNTGEQRVSAGATSLIVATAPLLTAVVATALGRERLPLAGWLGSALGFAGVALIVLGEPGGGGSTAAASGGPGAAGGSAIEPFAGFVLVSAVAAAFFAVLQRPLLARYRPVDLMAFATWAGTLPMLAFLPGFGGAVAAAGTAPLASAALLGVFPSALAYTLFAIALARAPATVVTPYLYLVPVFALILSWWWLGEVPTWVTAVGGAVVVVALAVVHASRRRAAARAALLARPVGD